MMQKQTFRNTPAYDEDDKYAKFNAAVTKPEQVPASQKVSHPPVQWPSPGHFASMDDDKYAKCNSASKHVPESLQKYTSALKLLETIPLPFIGFIIFVIVGCSFYFAEGLVLNGDKFARFCSSYLEILGLLILRHKIQIRNSVSGISGMTILMYAAVYAVRIWLCVPDSWNFEWKDLDFDASFGSVSLILILDILKSVFITYRSSYDIDNDIMKVQYVIPGCFLMALVVRPHFHTWTYFYGYIWGSCLYMDVLALMPQVVMMAQGGGKVSAPIAHFVAATFVSRIGDLYDSLFYETSIRVSDPLAYWMVVVFQSVHLLLVADFMYYYVKTRSSGQWLVDEVKLMDDV